MVKQTRIRGKFINGVFRVTEYQTVSDTLSSSTVAFAQNSTIMNILRNHSYDRVASNGFTYAFPLVFTE